MQTSLKTVNSDIANHSYSPNTPLTQALNPLRRPHSIGRVDFSKFQTGTFVEWKAPFEFDSQLIACLAPTVFEELYKRIQKKCWEYKSLTCFKFSETTCNRVCKRTQHVHATMLSPFARGFRGKRNQTRALQHDGFVPQEYTNEPQRALSRGPVNFSLIYNWW